MKNNENFGEIISQLDLKSKIFLNGKFHFFVIFDVDISSPYDRDGMLLRLCYNLKYVYYVSGV